MEGCVFCTVLIDQENPKSKYLGIRRSNRIAVLNQGQHCIRGSLYKYKTNLFIHFHTYSMAIPSMFILYDWEASQVVYSDHRSGASCDHQELRYSQSKTVLEPHRNTTGILNHRDQKHKWSRTQNRSINQEPLGVLTLFWWYNNIIRSTRSWDNTGWSFQTGTRSTKHIDEMREDLLQISL